MAKLELEVVTPEQPVLKTEADDVVLPGIVGEFGVLPGHTTLLAELGSGRMVVTNQGHSKTYQVSGGFAEVCQDRVTVLAHKVEGAE